MRNIHHYSQFGNAEKLMRVKEREMDRDRECEWELDAWQNKWQMNERKIKMRVSKAICEWGGWRDRQDKRPVQCAFNNLMRFSPGIDKQLFVNNDVNNGKPIRNLLLLLVLISQNCPLLPLLLTLILSRPSSYAFANGTQIIPVLSFALTSQTVSMFRIWESREFCALIFIIQSAEENTPPTLVHFHI